MSTNKGSLTATEHKDRQLKNAEFLYLSGMDIQSISEETDLPVPELRLLAFGPNGDGKLPSCWFYMRERAQYDPRAMVRRYNHNPSVIMKNISAIATGLTAGQLQSIANKLNPYHPDYDKEFSLPIDDLLKLIQIFEKMNISYRLEQDLSTANVNINAANMTVREIHNEREKFMYGKTQEEIDEYNKEVEKTLELVKKENFENPKSAKEIWQWEDEEQEGE